MHDFWVKKSGDITRGPQWTSGRPFQLEQEHALVTHATRAPKDGLDGGVDRLDDAKAHRVIAVRGDALDVAEQEVAEAFHLGQPLPAQGLDPAQEKIQNAAAGLIRPEA